MKKNISQLENEINENEELLQKHNKLLSYPKASEEIMYQVQGLLDSGADTLIGSLEYMIKKVTTHPDQMKEVDFIAATNGRKLISFLQFAKIYNIKNYE